MIKAIFLIQVAPALPGNQLGPLESWRKHAEIEDAWAFLISQGMQVEFEGMIIRFDQSMGSVVDDVMKFQTVQHPPMEALDDLRKKMLASGFEKVQDAPAGNGKIIQ